MRRGPKDILRAVVGRTRRAAKRFRRERRNLRREESATAAFTRRYAQALPPPLDVGSPETPSLPLPVDRRRVLVAARERPGERPSADVVVCVHDALADLHRCICSLLEKTGRPFHLILVDDGSGPETQAFLRRFVEANPAATLLPRSGPPHGYTLAANDGVRASSGDYVVLLNSDTVVTFGWLERLIDCGESDAAIGILGPLSNAASYQSVPKLKEGGAWAVNELPSFLTPDGLSFLLSRAKGPSYPRLPFLNGFCYAVKREVIEVVGLFDEDNFASGYCEENDFSYRASQAGFELAVADDVYVFHAKSRSYGQEGRREIARRNYQIFLDKHGPEKVNERVQALDSDRQLEPLRELVTAATADPSTFARAFREACPNPLSVDFLLHGVGRAPAGGVHSIYQEARGMRALGVDARVLVPRKGLDNARSIYADADEVFAAFDDPADLADQTGGRDVLVSTHFKTVAWVRALRERRDDFLPAYYVQDYEPFFFDERSGDGTEALASYRGIPDQVLFAKTRWLCDLVSRIQEVPVAKVEPSIDHETFHPGPRRRGLRRGPTRVLAMVRPRTQRRQPLATLRILDRLQSELGAKVEVSAFGCDEHELRSLSSRRAGKVQNLGVLTRAQVADALAQADVFLDFSTYQAFGRTALEAMACGCAAIVPQTGGTDEFAVHGENAFVIDTSNEDVAFEAVAELVRDRDLLRHMQSGALETARCFSTLRAALSEYVLFAAEHDRRARRSAVAEAATPT